MRCVALHFPATLGTACGYKIEQVARESGFRIPIFDYNEHDTFPESVISHHCLGIRIHVFTRSKS